MAVGALVVVIDGEGDDGGSDAETGASCDPAAPFERPAPRGFAFGPESAEMVERGYGRARRHTTAFRRDDFEARPVTTPGGDRAVAIAIRTPEEWTSEDLELAVFAAASEAPDARVSPREVPLGTGAGRLIRLEVDGKSGLMLLAASGCRLFMLQGSREDTVRQLAVHLVAPG